MEKVSLSLCFFLTLIFKIQSAQLSGKGKVLKSYLDKINLYYDDI